jgi:hypothetical protein
LVCVWIIISRRNSEYLYSDNRKTVKRFTSVSPVRLSLSRLHAAAGIILLVYSAVSVFAELPHEESEHVPNGWDNAHQAISTHIGFLSRHVDRFFEDSAYVEESTRTRLTVRQEASVSRNHDLGFTTHISASVTLPNMERRLRLMFDANEDVEDEFEGSSNFSDSLNNSFDRPSLRLQYGISQSSNLSLELAGGIVLKHARPFAGPRLRYSRDISDTLCFRATERFYRYTKYGWRSRTEFDLNQSIGSRNLLRQRVKFDWSEKKQSDDGVKITFSTNFFQPLSNKRVFKYGWDTVYKTKHGKGWDSTMVSVSYRQRLWRKWLVGEITPFTRWEDAYDWQTDPGIAMSVSVIFEEREK